MLLTSGPRSGRGRVARRRRGLGRALRRNPSRRPLPGRSNCGAREPTRSGREVCRRGWPERIHARARPWPPPKPRHARRHAMASATRRGALARIRPPRPWTEEGGVRSEEADHARRHGPLRCAHGPCSSAEGGRQRCPARPGGGGGGCTQGNRILCSRPM